MRIVMLVVNFIDDPGQATGHVTVVDDRDPMKTERVGGRVRSFD
jgi:hypothetical protein